MITIINRRPPADLDSTILRVTFVPEFLSYIENLPSYSQNTFLLIALISYFRDSYIGKLIM